MCGMLVHNCILDAESNEARGCYSTAVGFLAELVRSRIGRRDQIEQNKCFLFCILLLSNSTFSTMKSGKLGVAYRIFS